jgi:hypothetical protein
MGWGNPQPLAQLKRQAADRARLQAQLDDANAKLAIVRRLIDRNHVAVPSEYLRRALEPTNRCPFCVSAYVDCPVHA